MSSTYQLDHSLDGYVDLMKSYGVQVNVKLQPALFYLKNGLVYPGLLTKQEINGYEELVKIPVELLLTAHKAMKDPALEQVFSDKFYREGSMWQDRVLVTYILYLLATNKECIWTHMARQFSKDIDIVSFWPMEQFQSFVDRSVLKAAKKERAHFQQQWKRFQEIQQDYQVLQNKEWFTRQKYKWIYIHAISRCFGSFLKSTYFVPFCELFNHNCVDVSYTCFNENKLSLQNQSLSQQVQDNQSQESVSSGYSEDYLSDDDFDYMSISSYSIKWFSKISYDLKDKEVKAVEKQLKEVYGWMDKELEWKGFTLIYLGQMIEKLKIFQNEYKAGRQKYPNTTEKIEQLKLQLFAYRKHLVQLYRSQGRQYQKVKNERGVESAHVKNTNWDNFQKTKEESKQVYTHFRMEAREHAHFNSNSQIYFSYGKLSNRTLLVRYGFSLQSNPYEHVWIKFKLGKFIEPFPDLFQMIQEKGLTVNYKVKLKSYTFALEPIVFFRMLAWKATHHGLQDIFYITDLDKQLLILFKVQEIYEKQLGHYCEVNQSLEDPSLSYHDYFVRVYNLQKKKILLRQLELLKYMVSIFTRIVGKELDCSHLVIEQGYKKQLKHYLKGLRGIIKK